MQRHGERHRQPRRHPQRRAFRLETGAGLRRIVRRQGQPHQLRQVGAGPALAGQHLMRPRQGQQPRLEGFPGAGRDRAARASGPRKVCAAIDWTEARVFFTRWFSSPTVSRSWASARRLSVMSASTPSDLVRAIRAAMQRAARFQPADIAVAGPPDAEVKGQGRIAAAFARKAAFTMARSSGSTCRRKLCQVQCSTGPA